MKAFALLPFAILVAGCMTASPKSYQPVASASHFELAEDLMFTTRVSSGLAKVGSGTRVNGGIAIRKQAAPAECHMFIQVGDESQVVGDQGMGPVGAAKGNPCPTSG